MLAGLHYLALLQAGTASGAASTAASGVAMLIWLAVFGLVIVSMWKVFEKAGEPGWASLVPIYNMVVMLKIAEKPLWWLLLLFIPFVNIIVFIAVGIATAQRFGKGVGYGLGLTFLGHIFYPMLAFGDAQYSRA